MDESGIRDALSHPRAARRVLRVDRATIAVALSVALMLGGNAVSAAVLAWMSVAARTSAAEGAYLTFFDAYLLALPLALLVTGLVWVGSTERVNPALLAAGGALCAVAITFVAGEIGIDAVTAEGMSASIASLGGNWFVQVFGAIGEYLAYYTWVPFLGGVITGFAMGWTCAYLSSPDRR